MEYKTDIIELIETNDVEVAQIIYQIAGFPDGSKLWKSSHSFHGGSRSVIGVHRDSFRAPDDMPSPDFIITALLNGRYVVEYNERVYPTHIEALKIRIAQQRANVTQE